MKQLISTLAIVLCLTLQSNAQFTIHGEFKNSKGITYTLYKISDIGFYEQVMTKTANRKYKVKCEINTQYCVKFRNEDNIIKYMTFIAYNEGDIEVNVNFNNIKSITLIYKNNKATVKSFDNILAKI